MEQNGVSTSEQSAPSGGAAAAPEQPAIVSPSAFSAKGDLLLRFFESDFFDAWIAVTYLHKHLPAETHEYLCRRLYTLPETDVERYLSQLTQMCVSRHNPALEAVLLDLAAQSLRIAVKTYWLLLAISQDNPRNAEIATLRDRCEMAGLAGFWDLPFSEQGLSSPPGHHMLSMSRASSSSGNRFLRQFDSNTLAGSSPTAASGGGNSAASPVPVSTPTGARLASIDGMDMPPRGASSDALNRLQHWNSDMLSPDVPSRPMSPDGLGGGIFSSVFMDTGVEGLICDNGPQGGAAVENPTAAAAATATDTDTDINEKQYHSEQKQHRTPVIPTQQPADRGLTNNLPPGTLGLPNGGGGPFANVPRPLSPPTSPKRRETTFGATLDFVEALCTASSNLTAFPHDERQWALHKALHSINTEMDRAAATGVAIWWPMAKSADQRVVRLAYKESKLLNSREKAPFTLYVEVLDEASARAQREASKAAKQAAAAAAAALAASPLPLIAPPAHQAMALDAAAAEAAAEGIPWVAHHHRRNSSHDVVASFGVLPVIGEAAAATTAASRGTGSTAGSIITPTRGPATPAAAGDAHLLAATGASSATTVPPLPPGSAVSLISQRSEASTFATDLSLADFASESSHSPTARPSHHHHGRNNSGDGVTDATTTTTTTNNNNNNNITLPLLPRTHVQGGGTWIGASGIKAQGGASVPDLRSGLSAALAGLRGDAPLVSVKLHVIEDYPSPPTSSREAETSTTACTTTTTTAAVAATRVGSGHSSVSLSSSSDNSPDVPVTAGLSEMSLSGEKSSTGGGVFKSAVVHPEPSVAATGKATPVEAEEECPRTGWLCKLGLCKQCNSGTAAKTTPTPPQSTTAPQSDQANEPLLHHSSSTATTAIDETTSSTHQQTQEGAQPRVKLALSVQGGLDLALKRGGVGRHQRMPSHEALLQVAMQHKLPPPPLPEVASPVSSVDPTSPEATASVATADTTAAAAVVDVDVDAPYGEQWSDRKARLRQTSPHGKRPGWDVRSVIVKSGDDCRQELLAMQLISTFHDIFQEARLPLWLRPYEVLVTSNRTALIEMVPNAPSVHAVKASAPPGTSLRDHFIAKHGQPGSASHARAQRNFVESLAAYSIVCHLLQIRDRHNGNILIDDAGHLIHIDFGFMLSNSPGGVNFESAPFKLTRELLEVMDSDAEGRPSEAFDYFKVLLIQGFLAVRRHADRITLLVEMMADSGCPCFKNRVTAVQGLKRRLAPGLAEPAVVELVLSHISDSLDAWSTRQYDLYQRVLNGIL